jgi:hypothetical protein
MITLADLGTGGLLGIFGMALGAYLNRLFGRSGEIDAESSRLEQLAKKAFAEAFQGEAGKRLASHQDIENVLSEVRKVTTETESIKAQISGDAWLKQTIWVQKRESYSALLKSLTDLHDCFVAYASSLGSFERREPNPEDSNYGTRMSEHLKKSEATVAAMFQASLRFGETALFDPAILEQQSLFGKNYGLESAVKDNATSAEVTAFVVGLMKFRRSLVSHMRKELGIPESSSTLST